MINIAFDITNLTCICPLCGKNIKENTILCPYCGKIISTIEFNLADFFSLNSTLFVIMGIFGALSIYLHQIALKDSSEIPQLFTFLGIKINSIDFSIATSLMILILISLLIIYRLIFFGTQEAFQPNIGNITRIIFLLFFIGFIFGVVNFILNTPEYYRSIYLISIFIGIFIGVFLFFGLLDLLSKIIKKLRIFYLLVLFIFIAILVLMGYSITTNNFFILSILSSFELASLAFLIFIPIVSFFATFYKRVKSFF